MWEPMVVGRGLGGCHTVARHGRQGCSVLFSVASKRDEQEADACRPLLLPWSGKERRALKMLAQKNQTPLQCSQRT